MSDPNDKGTAIELIPQECLSPEGRKRVHDATQALEAANAALFRHLKAMIELLDANSGICDFTSDEENDIHEARLARDATLWAMDDLVIALCGRPEVKRG